MLTGTPEDDWATVLRVFAASWNRVETSKRPFSRMINAGLL
jgi:hypothetical protein